MVEYLLSAKNKSKYDSAAFEEFAYEHVLCHSRRVAEIKQEYLSRGKATNRGIVLDYYDRTEEQQRKTLPGVSLNSPLPCNTALQARYL